jgi:hypothetical protein
VAGNIKFNRSILQRPGLSAGGTVRALFIGGMATMARGREAIVGGILVGLMAIGVVFF